MPLRSVYMIVAQSIQCLAYSQQNNFPCHFFSLDEKGHNSGTGMLPFKVVERVFSKVMLFTNFSLIYKVCLNTCPCNLKTFFVLSDTTAEKHLKDLIDNHAFKDRGFLIHQSISEFQVYVVVSCVQSQNQTSGVSDVEGIERHCIVVGEQGDMTLRKINADPSNGQQFWNLDELYCSLLTQFGLQAQPCDCEFVAQTPATTDLPLIPIFFLKYGKNADFFSRM